MWHGTPKVHDSHVKWCLHSWDCSVIMDFGSILLRCTSWGSAVTGSAISSWTPFPTESGLTWLWFGFTASSSESIGCLWAGWMWSLVFSFNFCPSHYIKVGYKVYVTHGSYIITSIIYYIIHWRKNQGGWGGNCPPSLKTRGVLPPWFSEYYTSQGVGFTLWLVLALHGGLHCSFSSVAIMVE